MSWTANIKSVSSDPTAPVAKVEIEYIDGERKKIVVERISEPSSITKIVSDGIRELTRIDEVASLIANPPIGEVKVNLTPPEPTAEKVALQEYQQARQNLKLLKEDLDLGLIGEAEYTKALNEVLLLKP